MIDIKIYDKPKKFNDKQLNYVVQRQITFLEKIFSFLKDNDKYNDGAIEIRVLPRDEEKYINSRCFWHTNSDEDVEYIKRINKEINGKYYCLYYSCYAFDYSLNVNKKQKGRINNENALFTVILPMDFDNMTEEEFLMEKQKFKDLGIETIDIFTGHGFQSLIMLNEKVYDTTIIKKWTNLLLQKGIKVDSALVDAARVLRMPFSFNCKEFDLKKTEKYIKPKCIAAYIFNDTDKRYNIVDVFNKIRGLDDVIASDKEADTVNIQQQFITEKCKPISKKLKTKKIEVSEYATKEQIEKLYPMFKNKNLQDPLLKIFYATPEGLRNKTMLFLIPFLKNSMGFSINKIKEIMVIWGSRCMPALGKEEINKEVTRLYKNYNYNNGKYDAEMVKTFGYIDFSEVRKDNKVIVGNKVVNNLSSIKDTSFKILMELYLDKANCGQKNYTILDLVKLTSLSRRTLDRNLKELLAKGYITKRKKVSKLNKEQYEYYLNPYFESSKGFIMLDKLTLKTMIEDLTGAELKLCIYFFKTLGSEESVWNNQNSIANAIGKTNHSIVSKLTDSLEKKGFIKKDVKIIQNIKHCNYYLKY